MTTLMSKAIKRIEALPRGIQDELAKQLLEDIENELAWIKTFAHPQPKLNKLAEKALADSRAGRTVKLGFDDL